MKLRRNKKLLKYLDSTLVDSQLNLEQLLDEHFFSFQFEDNYGFGDYPNKGQIRKRIIELLFEIHDNWKIELDKLKKPYYLAIWLCEPQIVRSEVVCAIDERIDRYSNDWFDKSEKVNSFSKASYGKNQNQVERFTWERKKLYDSYHNSDYNKPKESYVKLDDYYRDQKFYRRVLPKCIKIEEGKYGKIYFREIGDVWVGIEK
jgi:hypothetical protein